MRAPDRLSGENALSGRTYWLVVEGKDRFLEEHEAFGGDLFVACADQVHKGREDLLRGDAPPAICRQNVDSVADQNEGVLNRRHNGAILLHGFCQLLREILHMTWTRAYFLLGILIVATWAVGAWLNAIVFFQAMAVSMVALLALIILQVALQASRELIYSWRLSRTIPGSKDEKALIFSRKIPSL
jgi:hypothetical protein